MTVVAHTISPSNLRQPDRAGRDDKGGPVNLIAHTLRASGFDASEDGTGRGTPMVIDWQSGGDSCGLDPTYDETRALHKSQTPALMQAASVRRLTPTECERLMAFPDGWTAVDGEGEYALKCDGKWRLVSGTPDGPRYAALGNSIVTNVSEWLGRQMLGAPQPERVVVERERRPSVLRMREGKDGGGKGPLIRVFE